MLSSSGLLYIMRNSNKFFDRISNSIIFSLIVIIVFLKIIIYIAIQKELLILEYGGGSDAAYYHAYAIGFGDLAANNWPVILRRMNEFGLYSREYVSHLLLFLNIVVIPILLSKIAGLSFQKHQKYYLYFFLLCLVYPTLYFYTFDVYRDVFMVFVLLNGLLSVKKLLHSNSFLGYIVYLSISIMIGLILLGLRPYLGYAFFLSLLLWRIKLSKNRIIFLSILYFVSLFIANYAGFLDLLTEYRSGFEENPAGSTLGLSFSNPLLFIPNFILSILGQLFGLYITNPSAIILFALETIPFSIMLIYVVKNIRLADSFVRFLIVFFVLYASVWLIGNDNLGTAVRLRIYNYLAIYICFFYILRLKKLDSYNKG